MCTMNPDFDIRPQNGAKTSILQRQKPQLMEKAWIFCQNGDKFLIQNNLVCIYFGLKHNLFKI